MSPAEKVMAVLRTFIAEAMATFPARLKKAELTWTRMAGRNHWDMIGLGSVWEGLGVPSK